MIRIAVGGLAAALVLASGASAGPQPAARSADGAAKNAASGREARVMVYVCDRSDETRRAFKREYGAQEFVTADSVQRVSDVTTPKCMTAAELRRYKDRFAH
ncbi:MAG: hypothetical protein IT546_11055 [Caulobacteraceae bacterium]|nr:hypothetical protein [Caulobacteraceae bacterium]